MISQVRVTRPRQSMPQGLAVRLSHRDPTDFPVDTTGRRGDHTSVKLFQKQNRGLIPVRSACTVGRRGFTTSGIGG